MNPDVWWPLAVYLTLSCTENVPPGAFARNMPITGRTAKGHRTDAGGE
jgi:hypothetical protein